MTHEAHRHQRGRSDTERRGQLCCSDPSPQERRGIRVLGTRESVRVIWQATAFRSQPRAPLALIKANVAGGSSSGEMMDASRTPESVASASRVTIAAARGGPRRPAAPRAIGSTGPVGVENQVHDDMPRAELEERKQLRQPSIPALLDVKALGAARC